MILRIEKILPFSSPKPRISMLSQILMFGSGYFFLLAYNVPTLFIHMMASDFINISSVLPVLKSIILLKKLYSTPKIHYFYERLHKAKDEFFRSSNFFQNS